MPCSSAHFPPQQPHFTPQCKCWGQCAEGTGAPGTGGTRADKHTCTLTDALGVLRHLWLPNSQTPLPPPHPPWTLFEAVRGLMGAVHSHSPMQGPLTPSMPFASSLSDFYCHPVSFPFLFFLLSALDFSISQTVPFAVPPFLAQSSVFLSLSTSFSLSLTLVLMSDPSRQSTFSQCAVRLKDTAHWGSERNKLTGTMFSLSM